MFFARRNLISNLLILLGALVAFIMSACSGQGPGAVPPQVIQVFVTATPLPPTETPTRTPTPTLTPTPTATAPAMEVAGDPRALPVLGPTPGVGANCGLVDTFDFPLNPPDASNIRGGQDFGTFRERYGKFHAGEDWGIRGGGSLGVPVHAIGHGTVTYANGSGWGLDLGVVIIRHYFPDGSTVLSFYGHLDPPSVALIPGQCIARGDVVGNIGDPSSSPHLHFEIRTTMAHVPGPGYWSEDPMTAGWLPPSETIWEYRMSLMPGFLWQNSDLGARELLGFIGGETYLVTGLDFLAGVYTPGGGLRWLHPLEPGVYRVQYAPASGLIYTITASARLTALAVPADGLPVADTGFLTLIWETTIPNAVAPVLAALPSGGIAVHAQSSVTAYGPGGEQLWSEPRSGPQVDQLTTDRFLIAATGGDSGGLAAYTDSGPAWFIEGLSGELAADGNSVYVLSADALYRVPVDDPVPLRMADLPRASRPGEILVLNDGRILVLHSDLADRRLLLFNEGALVWERSVKDVMNGPGQLQEVNGRIVLVTQVATQYARHVYVYLVEPGEPGLELIFEGGTRLPDSGELHLGTTPEGALLLKFGERAFIAIDLP